MEFINQTSFRQKLKNYKKHPLSFMLFLLVVACAAITSLMVLFLILYIFINGIPNLSLSLFEWNYSTDNVSMMPALINTVMIIAMSLVMAVPVGIFTAIYLVEYAKKGSKLVGAIRITTETLSGIPSIVYGLFGYLMFNVAMGFGYSLLGGAFTLAIMILPLIVRTTEEALIAVPDSFREGSFGLGAGRLRTVFKIVLPSAIPGILSGVILGIGRIVGETAALIYTAGTVTGIPKNVMGSGRTLAIHMYALLNEGFYVKEAFATSVVLLVLVFIINRLSGVIAKRISQGC